MEIVKVDTLKNEINQRLYRSIVNEASIGNHPKEGLKYFFNLEDPSKDNEIRIHEVLNDIHQELHKLGVEPDFNYWKELT